MAKPTQKQVAELSGVSQSIVSKVLRGNIPRNMSKAKIKSVLDAAEKLGYALPKPKEKPEAKPESAPSQPKAKPTPPPKFGATPQGNPLHKYGSQWKQHVANATGVMPKGDFTSLKFGEQKQVVKILNQIDKDGKKRTELTNKNYKQNQANRAMWKGVAIGAGAVGIPLSLAGIVNKLTDLIGDTAEVARQGSTLGINKDKLVAMDRQSTVMGLQDGELTSSLRNVQSVMTDMKLGVDPSLMTMMSQYGIGADMGKIQSIVNNGTSADLVGELYNQFNKGNLSNIQISSLLDKMGAGSLTELFTNKQMGKVLDAKPIQGAAQSAIELDRALGEVRNKINDLFIKNFDEINGGLDKFSHWLDTTDFTELGILFKDLAAGVSAILGLIPGFESTDDLKEKRSRLVEKYDNMQYVYNKIKDPVRKASYAHNFESVSKEIALVNNDLRSRGVDISTLNQSAKYGSEKASEAATKPKKTIIEHRYSVDINSNQSLNDDEKRPINESIAEKIKNDTVYIEERYGD